MKNLQDKDAYDRAKQHVECLRGFYIHLIFYLVINTLISSFKIYNGIEDGETFNEAFFDFGTVAVWLFWGIGLAIHGVKVIGLPLILGRNWEEEKIKKYIGEDADNRWE